jgi:uncharacterized protein (UPF0147 family)
MPQESTYLENIEKEFASAALALKEGNDGKVRVCARRAAGHAISWYLNAHPRAGWGSDAVSQLSAVMNDPAFPDDVRNAASRLVKRVSDDFAYSRAEDPVVDAKTIVNCIKKILADAGR